MNPRSPDVLIAGAGPAGLATALYLLRDRPNLSGILALEKARHPRPKTCAGGLIPKVMLALDELEIPLAVPSVEVRRGAASTPAGTVDLERGGETLCTVIRRDEFDARLAQAARERGLQIDEDTRILNAAQERDSVVVATDRGEYRARVLVGADGSGSRVRSAVFGRSKDAIGRALMADLPADCNDAVEFRENRYRFDFRCVNGGIYGYAWSFPCLIDGAPHLNVGIYDQCPRAQNGADGGEQSRMLTELDKAFPEFGLERIARHEIAFRAHPIRWFYPRDRYAERRVILAGDAAGVDPLMGEGISTAFEHGKLAARAIAGFLDGDRAALTRYDGELHCAPVARKLARLAFVARHFYGPRNRLFFRLARVSRRAQEIGVDWFNGAHHIDEKPTAALLALWARAVLFGAALR